MSKIAYLTIEQYRSLQGQYFTQDNLFNPSATADGSYFISEQEINAYEGQEFAWLKDLPLVDISNELPDTTVPVMTGSGVLIPVEAEILELFPNNTFNLGGFKIELIQSAQGLAVDLAYLNWQGFRDEQDKPQNATIKASFTALWYELLARYQRGEIISTM
ncbi:MAG TPA: hypothetical protein VGF79_00795 [Bacteroidia bacterium]